MPADTSKRCAMMAVLLISSGCQAGFESSSTDSGLSDGPYWPLHIIGAGDGADGVALYDIDGDRDLDAVTGFEEEGKLRLYFNPALPSPNGASGPWPSVHANGLLDESKIEDAIFADFDGDGQIDALVSASEGRNMRVGVHWLRNQSQIAEPAGWRGGAISGGLDDRLYIQVAVGQIDGVGLNDIVAGSKTKNGFSGAINLFLAPDQAGPAASSEWQGIELAATSWAVGLEIVDIDGDGDNDVLYSNRRRLAWLRNPGRDAVGFAGPWEEIALSGATGDFAFCDLDGDGDQDIVKTLGQRDPLVGGAWLERLDASGRRWREYPIRPVGGVPLAVPGRKYVAKGIACGDIDGDPAGRLDIAITASGWGHGVYWLEYPGASPTEPGDWPRHLVTESAGMKYDNVVLADVDLDSDLDIVTTEENRGFFGRGLGVVWYENQQQRTAPPERLLVLDQDTR